MLTSGEKYMLLGNVMTHKTKYYENNVNVVNCYLKIRMDLKKWSNSNLNQVD